MNPQSVVDLLEPLREPAAIGWWPPAPGWWFVGLLVLLILAFLGRRLWRYHQRGAPLRRARTRLDEITDAGFSVRDRVDALSRLQRQVAIRIAGRGACAGLTGAGWADFLNDLAPGDQRYFDATLAELPYRPQISEAEGDDVLRATREWLLALERPA